MTAFVCLTEIMWRLEASAAFDLFIKPQFCFSTSRPESLRVERMERKDRTEETTKLRGGGRQIWGEATEKCRQADWWNQGKKSAEQIKRSYCKHAEPTVPQLCVWQSRLKPFHFLFLILLRFSGSDHKHHLVDKHSCLCTLGVLSFIKGPPNKERVRVPLGKSNQNNPHIALTVEEGLASPVKAIRDSCRGKNSMGCGDNNSNWVYSESLSSWTAAGGKTADQQWQCEMIGC